MLAKMGFTKAGDARERSFPLSQQIPIVFANFSRHIDEIIRHQTGESMPGWDLSTWWSAMRGGPPKR